MHIYICRTTGTLKVHPATHGGGGWGWGAVFPRGFLRVVGSWWGTEIRARHMGLGVSINSGNKGFRNTLMAGIIGTRQIYECGMLNDLLVDQWGCECLYCVELIDLCGGRTSVAWPSRYSTVPNRKGNRTAMLDLSSHFPLSALELTRFGTVPSVI